MRLHSEFIGFCADAAYDSLRNAAYPRSLMALDFDIARAVARQGKTILFPSQQALALRPALAKFGESVDYRLPFPETIIQFDHPIPEHVFFEVERQETADPQTLALMASYWNEFGMPPTGWQPSDGDAITTLLLHQKQDADGAWLNQAIAFYVSTAANRVAWSGTDLLWIDPTLDINANNKTMLRNLAMAIVAYIHCVNMQLVEHATPEKVNRKRAAKGKRILQPYYTVEVRPEYQRTGEAGHAGSGTKHGHRYDVRGHFRRLSDGRLTWIGAHQRGLANELYIPATRKVRPES